MSQVVTQLPSWVQEVSIISVACISTVIAIWRYIRAESKKDGTPATIKSTEIVAASFIDSKLLKELIDTIRESDEEAARATSRLIRSNNELRESNIELAETVKLQSDAILNMTRYIGRVLSKDNISNVT